MSCLGVIHHSNALAPFTPSLETRWEKPPAIVTAAASEVHVWATRADESKVAAVWGNLSRAEQDRASQFRSHAARTEFIVARGALRSIASKYLGVSPQAVKLTHGQHGKPELAPNHGRRVRFNVSHSQGLILQAFSRREVGVDVEFIWPDVRLTDVSATVFSAAEILFLSQSSPGEQRRDFFRCWTRKEAFVKAMGEGLTDRIRRVAIVSCNGDLVPFISGTPAGSQWSIADLDVGSAFVAAVAIAGRNCSFRFWHWSC
jgi:4'-phosphopantetheinyl transferase